MMARHLSLWWTGRSQREQRLLSVMAGLLALVLGWLLVAQPLIGALEDAKLRHGEAVIAAAEARAQADRSRRSAQPAAMAPALPIDGLISRTATEAGFTGARIIGRSPARASIAVDAARAEAYFAWIAGLERQGVTVESLRASANPDRTLRTEAVFAARGR
ncbi:MAG TPA: type II secretion system protein GspM [Allosphingosinicella sp.]|nr:type II secretion system protein GspM [Allosphingosinicella sp.]